MVDNFSAKYISILCQERLMKYQLPYDFGVKGLWSEYYEPKGSHIKRIQKLLKLPEKDLILAVCKHYIQHFIPSPIQNEEKYWIISCFPSTDCSPVRVSIWFPEVFNIHLAGDYYSHGEGLHCMIFVHTDYWDDTLKKQISGLFPKLYFAPSYRFVTGIDQQLAIFMPLDSYFDFVSHEVVYESIRVHNYELSLKGKTPFKKGHNPEFVRYIFGDVSVLDEI